MSDFTSSAPPEVEAAALFLSSYLPPLHTASFTSSLVRQLTLRYSGHWYPTDPEKGSAYRAIVHSGSSVDQSLWLAAQDAGIDRETLVRSLEAAADGERPDDSQVTATPKLKLSDQWTLWVDPGLVLLRLDSSNSTSKGSVGLLEGHLVTIYGSIQRELPLQSIDLSQVLAPSFSSPPTISAVSPSSISPTPLENISSPTKCSRAIQILHPPTRTVSGTFAQSSLPSPPTITPPTPLRPSTTILADVFSSEESSPPLQLPLLRPSSRGSFSSSSSGSSSDDDASSSSSASSVSTLWPPAPSPPLKMDGEFKYPSLPQHLPSRPSSSLSSHSSYTFPSRPAMSSNNSYGSRPTSAMSNHSHSSSTSSSYFGSQSSHANHQRAPSSPSKPRRRGTRGGGSTSTATHSSQSSLDLSTVSTSSSVALPRKVDQVKEYAGNSVGVLSGGCKLGDVQRKDLGDTRGRSGGETRQRGRGRQRGGYKAQPQPIAVY